MKGPLTVRIGGTNVNLISQRLIALKSSIPKKSFQENREVCQKLNIGKLLNSDNFCYIQDLLY